MVILVSFEEICKYVENHYGQRIRLSRVNEKELCVDYVKRILIKNVSVDVNVHIDDVKSDSLTVSYKGGMAVDMMISGALNFFLDKFSELSQGITKMENHSIRVNLAEIKKTKAIVKSIAMRDIEVEEKGIKVTLALK